MICIPALYQLPLAFQQSASAHVLQQYHELSSLPMYETIQLTL